MPLSHTDWRRYAFRFKRNERSIDVLYGIVMSFSQNAAPPSSEIFQKQIPKSLAKGKHSYYTILVRRRV